MMSSSIILIISFIYCCACKSTIADIRRRLVHWRLNRDEEHGTNTAHLHETISINQQIQNDIRNKYLLK
jgi:hypothetical protein